MFRDNAACCAAAGSSTHGEGLKNMTMSLPATLGSLISKIRPRAGNTCGASVVIWAKPHAQLWFFSGLRRHDDVAAQFSQLKGFDFLLGENARDLASMMDVVCHDSPNGPLP